MKEKEENKKRNWEEEGEGARRKLSATINEQRMPCVLWQAGYSFLSLLSLLSSLPFFLPPCLSSALAFFSPSHTLSLLSALPVSLSFLHLLLPSPLSSYLSQPFFTPSPPAVSPCLHSFLDFFFIFSSLFMSIGDHIHSHNNYFYGT